MGQENLPLYQRVTLWERALITYIVMTGAFMAILDTTIVDIIVPKLLAPLKTDLYGVQWVITAYMIASATGLILSDWLDKKFGLKNIYIAGIVLFTFSSYMCGQSESLEWMITFRVLQGVGEAFIMVTAQTILFSVYPPEQKGLAMGIFGLGVSFAPALGPTLGGYITEYINWRWVFYINIPFGILTTILALFYLPKSRILEKPKLNFISFFFLSVFTITLLVILSKGQQLGWFYSDFIVYLTVICIFSILFYILSELLSKEPLIDFRIFLNRDYTTGFLLFFLLLGFSLYQIFYLLPLYYEQLKGLSTLDAGIHILALAVFIAIFSPVAGILSDKIGEKYVLYISVVIYLFSSLYLLPKFNYYTPSVKAAVMTIPLGIAMGMFFAPTTTMALRNLSEDMAALGTGLMHYARFVGGSFGTAIATNELLKNQAEHFEGIVSMQNYSYLSIFLEKLKTFGQMFIPESILDAKMKALFYFVETLHSYSYSFQDTFFIAGLFGIIGSIPIFIYLFSDIKRGLRI